MSLFSSPHDLTPLAPDQSAALPLPAGGYRDRDAFAAIVTALADTGEFSDVILGEAPGQNAAGAARTPLAVVAPEQWTESDNVDPCLLVRHVSFKVLITIRDEYPYQGIERLDRLSSVAQDVLDGSDLNGGCIPALTKLRQGRFDPSTSHPEQRVVLDGEFTYLVSPLTGHDITP